MTTVEGIGLVRDRGFFLTYSVNIPCGMETGWPAENPRLSFGRAYRMTLFTDIIVKHEWRVRGENLKHIDLAQR
jgi:hypothetical protein